MNRILILVASLFLLAGSVVGSIADALEPSEGMQGLSLSHEAQGDYAPQESSFEKSKKSSSDDGVLPEKYKGCHGHCVGIAVDVVAGDDEILPRDEAPRLLMAKLPLSAFIGTFRPPIS